MQKSVIRSVHLHSICSPTPNAECFSNTSCDVGYTVHRVLNKPEANDLRKKKKENLDSYAFKMGQIIRIKISSINHMLQKA